MARERMVDTRPNRARWQERPNCTIEIDSDYFPNWHLAYLHEIYSFGVEIALCINDDHPIDSQSADTTPRKPEQLAANLKAVLECRRKWSSKHLSEIEASLQVEAYQAVAFWEQSPRTDADVGAERQPTCRPPSLGRVYYTTIERDLNLLEEKNRDYPNESIADFARKKKMKRGAMSMALRRAKTHLKAQNKRGRRNSLQRTKD